MSVRSIETTDTGNVKEDLKGVGSLVDEYTAVCTSKNDGLAVLRRDLPHLQRGRPHPREAGYIVDSFEGRREPQSSIWRISVTYTNQFLKNPLGQPASVTMRSQSLSSYTLVDHKGRLMLNTAGDPFEPQEKKEVIWVFSVKKNVADFPDWILEYPECINTDAVRIRGLRRMFPPKTLALAALSIDDYQEENEIQFRPLTAELHYRRSTWQTYVPSRGYQELQRVPSAFGTRPEFIKRRIVLPDQSFPNEPQLLDKDGKWLFQPRPQDVHVLKFQIPEDKPFSVLPLM